MQRFTMDLSKKEDPGTPKSAALSTLFCRLTSVTHLTVKHSTRIAKLLLTPKAGGRPLSSLVVLFLTDPFTGWSNPFNPSHYSNLGRYSSLNWLELDVDRPLKSLGRFVPPAKPVAIQLGGIDLLGYLNGNPAVPHFLSSCNNPVTCVLTEKTRRSKNNISPLLQHLPFPDEICFLSFGQEADGDEDLSTTLKDFPWLENIDFRAGTYTPSVLPVLHSMLFLTNIIFAPYASITTNDILSLLGPQRPPNLKRIQLSVIHEVEEWDWYGEYTYPVQRGWSAAFSKTGVEEVIKEAEKVDVELTGLAVEVVKKEKAAREAKAAREKAKKEASGAVA